MAWNGKGFDHEAITKVSDSTVVIASEGKCRLKEYLIKDYPAKLYLKGWENVWPPDNFILIIISSHWLSILSAICFGQFLKVRFGRMVYRLPRRMD